MTERISRRLLPALAASLMLSACAVNPDQLTYPELQQIADNNTSRVTADQEPLSGPVTLYEAMARALKYNLDFRVEMMRKSLRSTELHLSHYEMLPAAVTNSGYAARDSFNSTGELDFITGQERVARTTSQEKRRNTADITFSWNILDFGLSYIRAHQQADKVLIAEEAKRKVVQRIIEDTRTAYWRAVSSDRMIQKLRALEGRTRTALANARSLTNSQETSPVASLTYERELIEITRAAQRMQRELSVAKTQLAALMNVEPGTHYELAHSGLNAKTPHLATDAQEMIAIALMNRPELRDVEYQRRINEQEARAAVLELLPGIDLYAGRNHDSNKYLDNNQWVNWGAKATWNVLRVFQYPAKRDVIEAQDKLLDSRALALTMAIMTQVHVSRVRYAQTARELHSSREYFDVQRRLVEQMRQEAAAERISEQTLIREELNTLVAEAQRDIAFAATQNAFANVFASIGLDPYYDEIDLGNSVSHLSAQLKDLWLERGDFGAQTKVSVASR
jgi:outer membrane protein TolC